MVVYLQKACWSRTEKHAKLSADRLSHQLGYSCSDFLALVLPCGTFFLFMIDYRLKITNNECNILPHISQQSFLCVHCHWKTLSIKNQHKVYAFVPQGLGNPISFFINIFPESHCIKCRFISLLNDEYSSKVAPVSLNFSRIILSYTGT